MENIILKVELTPYREAVTAKNCSGGGSGSCSSCGGSCACGSVGSPGSCGSK